VDVPVTEYRRRLAHYHALAREGEPIDVTERGKPVVRVTAPGGIDVLARLAAEGRAQPPRRAWAPLPGSPAPYEGPAAEEQVAAERR
jgi:prevent-host-death family protein